MFYDKSILMNIIPGRYFLQVGKEHANKWELNRVLIRKTGFSYWGFWLKVHLNGLKTFFPDPELICLYWNSQGKPVVPLLMAKDPPGGIGASTIRDHQPPIHGREVSPNRPGKSSSS